MMQGEKCSFIEEKKGKSRTTKRRSNKGLFLVMATSMDDPLLKKQIGLLISLQKEGTDNKLIIRS